MIEDIVREKWTAIYSFLIMDFIQILFVSILYLDDTNLFVVGFNPGQTNPLISASLFVTIAVMQIIMLYLSAGSMLRSPDLIELYPHFNKETAWNKKYTPDEIVKWTMELAKKSEVSIKKIFLMVSPLPNAYTFSLPLIGSIVIVHSNTLDVLNKDEVQAIIAHELGHIKNQDSIVTIFTRMPSFFVDIIYLYIYIRLVLAIANSLLVDVDIIATGVRAAVLLAFIILSRMLTLLSKFFMQKASRSAELLSDYHAASVIGYEATINGLIRLGQRVEAITVLVDEIRWLESLNPERSGQISNAELLRMITQYPLDGIDERNAREIAPQVFLSTKLKNLREVYGVRLDEEEVKNAVEPAIQPLLKMRNDAIPTTEKSRDKKVVDWRKADSDGNRRLSTEEIAELLKMLRSQPKKMLFDMEVGVNMLILDHPDFRRRVLFIADEFGL
ncbi:MAG: M48 family metalloprotease [Candidatus Thorarchaeota archaeon]|nr:M48 family metalloprotease [Candidatus Thorarchaeota archaeon]